MHLIKEADSKLNTLTVKQLTNRWNKGLALLQSGTLDQVQRDAVAAFMEKLEWLAAAQ